jgi:hypothetical protein
MIMFVLLLAMVISILLLVLLLMVLLVLMFPPYLSFCSTLLAIGASPSFVFALFNVSMYTNLRKS